MLGRYQDIPKAELHLHLEGSLEPETLMELSPGLSREEALGRYRYAGFDGFIESFKWAASHLASPEHYAIAAARLAERLARENVRYAEVTVAAGVILWKGQAFAPIYDALRGVGRRSPVEIRWVLDAIRNLGPDHAMEVARLAAERVDDGVIAFGIGGSEALGPVEWFGDVFRFARERGLHLTIHAGETAGPESVWGAVRLGAERIGHGIRAVEDPELLRYLRDNRIPLEVCISSNVATGVVARLEEHPVRRIYDAGVPVTLATDDSAMFRTTLSREYEIAAESFGFTDDELRGIAENGFRYAFAATG